ncbi:MAG: tRNA1(Val) (adenine(37)-N6)-methyltransferase [Firmicutes bacterium]|nr:tRNA1(Val) (adenine(37)-N6)-methyltransferase [Bacillota bacterium]
MDIIREDESIEDLQLGQLKIIQKKNGFRFGVDAVLLANYAKDIRSAKTLDLCTGNAIVPVLMSHKTQTPLICGIEIQKEVFSMAERTVRLNGLSKRVRLNCGDINDAEKFYKKREFDVITCNPPYIPCGTAVKNDLDTKVIARHEVLCSLEDVIRVSAKLLKQQGHLVMVHRPSRLADIIYLMRCYEIEPKRVRFVHNKIGTEPTLILIDGMYKGGKELRIAPPLYLFDENGEETEELKRIYER